MEVQRKEALLTRRLEIPQEITYRWNGAQVEMPKLSPELRTTTFEEVELGFTEEQAVAEGSRCFGCESELCIGCGVCVDVCPVGIIYLEHDRSHKGEVFPKEYMIDIGLCMFCGICTEECPTKCLVATSDYELAAYTKAEFLIDKADFQDPSHKHFAL